MDRRAVEALHLQPRSSEQLHMVRDSFELKWQRKANRVLDDDDRISRF